MIFFHGLEREGVHTAEVEGLGIRFGGGRCLGGAIRAVRVSGLAIDGFAVGSHRFIEASNGNQWDRGCCKWTWCSGFGIQVGGSLQGVSV